MAVAVRAPTAPTSPPAPAAPRRAPLRRSLRLNLITVPLLLVVCFFWGYPILWVISTAFKTQLGAFTTGASLIPQRYDFSNFVKAWVDAGFSANFANTVIYSASATVVELTKSALCGYVLARYRFPGRDLLYRVILLTLFVPVASIIIPQFVLVENLGLLNSRLGVILAMSGGAGALYVLFFTSFFETLPQDLFDAAQVDGANFFQTFWLMLPLARPVIAVVVIFQFLHSWNDFVIPLVFTLGQPDLQNLAVALLHFHGAHPYNSPEFAAAMLISYLPVLMVFLLFQGYFVRGLAGAVKG